MRTVLDKIPENGADISAQLNIKEYKTQEECPSLAEVENGWLETYRCVPPAEFIASSKIDRDKIKDIEYHFILRQKSDTPDDLETGTQMSDAYTYATGFLANRGSGYEGPFWLGCAVFSKTGYSNIQHAGWRSTDYNGRKVARSVPLEEFRKNGVNTTLHFLDELQKALDRLFPRIEFRGPYIGAIDIDDNMMRLN